MVIDCEKGLVIVVSPYIGEWIEIQIIPNLRDSLLCLTLHR